MTPIGVTQSAPRSFLPYVVAVLAVALATGIVFLIPAFITRGALVIYIAVVLLVTWFGGWRAGVLATALCALAAAYWILPPDDSFAVQSVDDALRLGAFVFVAALIVALHASRERALGWAWQTEQRLAFALECAHMGAWYTDLRTGKFWWSAGMEELFGRAPGEFSGTYDSFIGYIHPDDQDFVKRALTKTIEGGKEFEIEHRIVRPDGEVCWIITHGRIIIDDAGHPKMITGVALSSPNARHSVEDKAGGSPNPTQQILGSSHPPA